MALNCNLCRFWYHFTAKAALFKYVPRQQIPPETELEQGRDIALLSLWLKQMDAFMTQRQINSHGRLSPEALAHTACQRMHCLSTLIYVSTILSANEEAYDVHLASFQRIVSDASLALQGARWPLDNLGRFSPAPGILQPLNLTSLKCRDPFTRRRAIELMYSVGREGPFYSAIIAPVSLRAVEIEESAAQEIVSSQRQVPEWARLHGVGTDAEASAEEEHEPFVNVTFSRCRSVDRMTSGSVRWDDLENWNMWVETVAFQEDRRRVQGLR